jgi:signal recognition particle receptor subunit beta
MPFLDFKNGSIVWKVVYYGPGLSGKTTNLRYLATLLGKSHIRSISGEGERTVFFDYLPVEFPKVDGLTPVFKIYTSPGQVKYSTTRQVLLNGVDGIVFVADSQKAVFQNNVDSLTELKKNLTEVGLSLERLPVVFQYNKQDLPNTYPPEGLDQLLNDVGATSLPGVAATGYNVKETVDVLGNQMVERFFKARQDQILEEITNMEVRRFVDFFKEEQKLETLKWLVEHGDDLKKLVEQSQGLMARVDAVEKAVTTFNKVLESFNGVLSKLQERLTAVESRGLLGLFRKKPGAA